jgi:hypothetical protein
LQCPQCVRQFENINAWMHHTIREHQTSGSKRICTINSHDNGNVIPMTPISVRGAVDHIKQSDKELNIEIGLVCKDQPNKDVIGFENIKRGLNLFLSVSNKENKRRATLINDLSELCSC